MKPSNPKTATTSTIPRAILAVAALLISGHSPAAPVKGPNILFILTDDHRWDGLGCYGNASIRTPHLDRLSAGGARFDSFYTAAPLCSPSRAAFLSGLPPHQNGVLSNHLDSLADLPDGMPTIATHLNRAGYATGFIGKTHLGGDPRRWGFSECPAYVRGGTVRNPLESAFLSDGARKKADVPITRTFADAANSFMERHKNDRWFLWLATTAPHGPLFEDPKHPYSMDGIKPPPGWPPKEGFPAKGGNWPHYYSTISHLDEQMGRVLAKLDELGLTENTFVLMAGDNGFMMGSHGHPNKQVWFEESVRVPALARWPGHIRPGTVVASPIVGTDLLATTLELAGTEKPAGLECVSMIPALTGGKPLRQTAYSEVLAVGLGHWQMVRHGPWKYVAFRGSNEEHLYNLDVDPFEQKDLATAPGSAKPLEEMRKRLAEWLSATPDLKVPEPVSKR